MISLNQFTDKQKKTFVLLDRLDERWVNDHLRYRLIRSLLEAAKYINSKLSSAKVIFAIREDLMERVFRLTRDSGFQEEKYRSLHLQLSWDKDDLLNVLDKRIDKLVRYRYQPSKSVKLEDVLTNKIAKQKATDYLLNRTLLTPRDAIALLNECIKVSKGKVEIVQRAVSNAEVEYSRLRLRALGDEWSTDYSDLLDIVLKTLKGAKDQFTIVEIANDDIPDKMLEFLIEGGQRTEGYFYQIVTEYLESRSPNSQDLLKKIFSIFHTVGILGVRPSSGAAKYWAHERRPISKDQLDITSTFFVHPAFWNVLSIKVHAYR